mmetsp:Transcript_10495/g.33935  ORF Transcript_10495/g.33935 Transcript_10495/m.33935 type:complete len:206 (-) Transcript_10495:484-1101(-)
MRCPLIVPMSCAIEGRLRLAIISRLRWMRAALSLSYSFSSSSSSSRAAPTAPAAGIAVLRRSPASSSALPFLSSNTSHASAGALLVAAAASSSSSSSLSEAVASESAGCSCSCCSCCCTGAAATARGGCGGSMVSTAGAVPPCPRTCSGPSAASGAAPLGLSHRVSGTTHASQTHVTATLLRTRLHVLCERMWHLLQITMTLPSL